MRLERSPQGWLSRGTYSTDTSCFGPFLLSQGENKTKKWQGSDMAKSVNMPSSTTFDLLGRFLKICSSLYFLLSNPLSPPLDCKIVKGDKSCLARGHPP